MTATTTLGKLRTDVRGNTLAMMAAALIPLIGFSGSAIDMARLYVVKVRMQQACDAGVLAGRKTMTDSSLSTALDSVALTQANTFFANNFFAKYDAPTNTFAGSWFGTTAIGFTPQKAAINGSLVANAVTGTATATVPMTLMKVIGAVQSVPVSVNCQAVFDIADTDVMFVLDTTGSMSCWPSDPDTCATSSATFKQTDGTTAYYNPEKSQTTDANGLPMYSKLESVRQAVVLFDTTIRNNADTSTHFRYGFVPYNSAMNVGKIIPSQYLQNGTWNYQSRQVSGDYNFGSTTNFSTNNTLQANCSARRSPASGYSTTGATWSTSYPQAVNYSGVSWKSANGGTCSGIQQPVRAMWSYQQWPLNVSQYVAGASVPNPSRIDGSTSIWRGCIEEVNTTPSASFNVTSLPDDLNPDFIPSAANEKWRPMWPDAVWLRDSAAQQSVKDENINESAPDSYTDVSYRWGSYFAGVTNCGMPAQRLQTMSAQQVHDYVYANDFRPAGGTYHDVGLIWGTRMLSPTGVFASDTAAWPGRNAPSRTIVFMTDGAMAPQPIIYGQYGAEMLDLRVDGSTSNIGSSPDYDKALHTARFRVECDAAKARGMTIYVVAVGTATTADLNYCDSSGTAIAVASTDALTAAFKNIALRVAKLRISQ